jgi:hypothetical protein
MRMDENLKIQALDGTTFKLSGEGGFEPAFANRYLWRLLIKVQFHPFCICKGDGTALSIEYSKAPL